MPEGSLVAIYVAPSARAPMALVPRARAVEGRGLEGDRYFLGAGTWSLPPQPDAQVTLIEEEAVAAVARETRAALSPRDTRRNLVTSGVRLEDLAGREFTIGSVHLKGHGPCEPCTHLESLVRPGLKEALLHRGGLRAEILAGGTLEPGQPVRLSPGR